MRRRDGKWTPEYMSWVKMRSRCHNPHRREYPRYGGRGISICERWQDFQAFLEDMGPRPPGHSLDRINGDGDYTPENCRWATARQQAQNRKGNRLVTYRGLTLCVMEWSRRLGIKRSTLRMRLERGWPVEKAFSAPVAVSGPVSTPCENPL